MDYAPLCVKPETSCDNKAETTLFK